MNAYNNMIHTFAIAANSKDYNAHADNVMDAIDNYMNARWYNEPANVSVADSYNNIHDILTRAFRFYRFRSGLLCLLLQLNY